MSLHDVRVHLAHVREHLAEAVEFTKGRKREDLESDRMLVLALTRLIEVAGEAANRVPQEKRAEFRGAN